MRRHSLFHGTLLLTAASLILRGSSMCFQVYLSNRIGAAGIGLLQLISSVSFFAMTLGSAGIRVASMYLTAEEFGARRPGGMRKALLCCLIYGVIVSSFGGIVLHRLSDWISAVWIQDPRAASSLRILAWSMPFSCLWSIMSGYLTACSKISQLVWIEFVDQMISIAVTVLLLTLWAGVDTERACISITLGGAVATALTLFLLLSFALRRNKAKIPKGLSMWKRLFRLCIPLAANDALRSGLSTTEQMLIPRGLTRSGSTAEGALAAYGTIHGMVFPLIMFPSVLIYSLSDLLVPELAKCRAAKNHIRIRSLTDRCLRMGLVFASAFFGLCHSLSQPLGLTLYHSSEAAHYLRIFAPLIPILYMDAMVDGMHKGLGEQLYCVRINTATNLMDVILLGLLLPRWGITGYLFTFTLTHLLNFFLSLNHLINVTGYSPSVPFVGKVLCTTVGATCIATIWIRLLPSTATALVCGSMIYVAAFSLLLSVTASLTPEDCQWLRSVLPVRKAD